MSKQKLGTTIAALGALGMIINISFLKEMEWYNLVRWITLALFLGGIILVPEYSHSKSKDQKSR